MIPIIILAIEDDDDREFMIRLYTDHRALLYSVIYEIVKNPEDTEDLVMDVVAKLIDLLDLLKKFGHKALVSYLAEMAKNRAVNFVTSAARRKNVSIADYEFWEDRSAGMDEILIEKMWINNLDKVWPTLKEDTRRILTMKYFLSMPDEEIAAEFQIKPASVRMRLKRAREEALKALESIT